MANNAISQKVSSTDVEGILSEKAYATKSELTQTSNSLTSTITGLQTDVGGKADKTEISQLSQDLSGFKTTVANTYADKVSVASQITQLSDSINLKVSKGDVVSQINLEAGKTLINSNKLVLNANTTEIAGDAFIRGDMIVDGSVKAEKLEVTNLSALTAIIGKIYNEFDNSSGGIDNKGTITIEDSVKVVYYLGNSSTTIDLVTSSSGQGLFTQYLPDKTDASKFRQSWYMPTGIYFTDSINNWNGQITAENVTLVPWNNLILKSGYTTGDGVQPQYRRI